MVSCRLLASLDTGCRLGPLFCGNVVAVTDIEQVGDLAHQVQFVCVQMAVSQCNLPELFHDTDFLCSVAGLVDQRSELVVAVCLMGFLFGKGDQGI